MPLIVSNVNNYDAYAFADTVSLAAAATNYVHLSLGPWPNKARLKRLRIESNTASVSGSMDILVLTDPAGYRAATVTDPYIQLAWNNETGAGDPMTTWVLDELINGESGSLVEDSLKSNRLHIYLYSEGMSDASTYTVRAWGQQVLDYKTEFTHQALYDQVYWVKDTNDVYTDLTEQCLSSFLYEPTASFSLWTAATDYFYIGCFSPFTKVMFNIATAATGNKTLSADYYGSSGWTPIPALFDCTDSCPSGTATPFSHSGVISWALPTDIIKSLLPSADGIPPDHQHYYATGTGWAGDGDGRPRYWVRFAVDGVANSPTFHSIRILPT